ncbi:MAG TPA: nucleoside diphosphate kinase regulator [Anaeromyxobacteraceae bacterium]|nr:nucleoside diphosphate kinase regulator [Anaeromyxobacteraceae bacterium]
MAERIYVRKSELDRLLSLVEQHPGGVDATAVERLEGELDRAIVVGDGEPLPPDVVTMDSRVVFEDGRTGNVREVTLVYPGGADASAGRVSVLAPIGAALLGLRAGDTIEWPLPQGRTARIRILSVAQPGTGDGVTAA